MSVNVRSLAVAARSASSGLALSSATVRNEALMRMADALEGASDAILQANDADLKAARMSGIGDALLDRLSLAGGRLQRIANDVRDVSSLPDPLGESFDRRSLPNGLDLCRVRVPLGVVAVVYEARPNVTADIAALAVKTGNATILRGGSETLRTNQAMVSALRGALEAVGISGDVLQLIADTDRTRIAELIRMDDLVDLVVPRGGAALQRFCLENGTVPVIVGGIGICHLFADASCDHDRSLDVIENAKCSRPSVCNALDTLLVHREIANEFLPMVYERLSRRAVTFRVDDRAWDILHGRDGVVRAGVDDFQTEWMELVLGVKVVDNIDDAIAHIAAYGDHSDGILTENDENADKFVRSVDSAAVFVNASTRFNDGGQFGLGAEVAVSTRKIHARGPMGLESLTSTKWVARGTYSCRE